MALKIHKETMLLKKQFSRQSVGDNYDEVELCVGCRHSLD